MQWKMNYVLLNMNRQSGHNEEDLFSDHENNILETEHNKLVHIRPQYNHFMIRRNAAKLTFT